MSAARTERARSAFVDVGTDEQTTLRSADYQIPTGWRKLEARRQARRQEREMRAEASVRAREVVRHVTEVAFRRALLIGDGQLRDIRAGMRRLRSFGCSSEAIERLEVRRASEVIDEAKLLMAEFNDEVVLVAELPLAHAVVLSTERSS